MAVLTSLLAGIELDEVNSNIIFTDLIGGGYNTTYGYILSDIKGLIKISGSQTGVVYKNSGWDADDYTLPDIISTSWSKTLSGTIPVGQDNLILKQFYTIEYKISVDAGVSTFLSFLQIFQNIYSRPTIDITSVTSLVNSILTFTDATNYTLTLNNNNYSPTTITRNFDITWPVGSAIPNTVSSNVTVQLGADIWSGYYLNVFTVNLEYLLLSAVNGLTVTVVDEIQETMHRVAVVYQEFTGLVNQALLQITASYENYKLYNLPYADNYQEILADLMMYYDMFKMANLSNEDMGYSMTKIYDILTSPALDIVVTLKVAEIIPNPSTDIYQKFTILTASYTAATDGVSVFNIPEMIGGTPLLTIRGTQPIFAGTGKDFTYNTAGDITMNNPLGMYESVFFWISKLLT